MYGDDDACVCDFPDCAMCVLCAHKDYHVCTCATLLIRDMVKTRSSVSDPFFSSKISTKYDQAFRPATARPEQTSSPASKYYIKTLLQNSSSECVHIRHEIFTSFAIHHVDSLDKQRAVRLGVFNKHYEELQSRLHHQPRLKEKDREGESVLTCLLHQVAASKQDTHFENNKEA